VRFLREFSIAFESIKYHLRLNGISSFVFVISSYKAHFLTGR